MVTQLWVVARRFAPDDEAALLLSLPKETGGFVIASLGRNAIIQHRQETPLAAAAEHVSGTIWMIRNEIRY
jgi:hypothetical protein